MRKRISWFDTIIRQDTQDSTYNKKSPMPPKFIPAPIQEPYRDEDGWTDEEIDKLLEQEEKKKMFIVPDDIAHNKFKTNKKKRRI